jgi:hypothetical protein
VSGGTSSRSAAGGGPRGRSLKAEIIASIA